MRITPIGAAVIAVGALLGGATAVSAVVAPKTVQQHTATSAPSTDVVVLSSPDNNGNG